MPFGAIHPFLEPSKRVTSQTYNDNVTTNNEHAAGGIRRNFFMGDRYKHPKIHSILYRRYSTTMIYLVYKLKIKEQANVRHAPLRTPDAYGCDKNMRFSRNCGIITAGLTSAATEFEAHFGRPVYKCCMIIHQCFSNFLSRGPLNKMTYAEDPLKLGTHGFENFLF